MMKSEKVILEIINVSKSYLNKGFFKKSVKNVLNGVTFSLYEGEIVGLVGVNGAGKTTIIKIICGITTPDSGEIKFFYKNLSPHITQKSFIGYMSEIPYFCQKFTVKDTIKFFYHISNQNYDINNLSDILKLTSINNFLNEKIQNLSKGMLQKLAIACALVNDPKLLILDEPTSGLDPLYVKNMREILLELNKNGKTIFFSSHTISEIEKICNRVIFINKGKIIRILSKDEFKDNLENIFIESVENDI
ncbi:MAG: ABC transporter ATP-binding protein [Elusimicrobiales bacterium]|nr:ABC transporter ATP-binding protein [Elusimicrobiales bacterium]